MGSPENIDSNRLSNERKSIESSIHGSGDVPQKDIWKNVESAPDPTPNNPSVKTITSEASENPHIRDAIAIDIGTSKCNIATCKDKYIQIIEHESSRSVPLYVALSEQGEWLVGKMAENYAVCLQNVIYENAMKRIVDAMPSSTTTQDQPEVIIPFDDIPVELIDEPIAVAAAYAPRLNIHPKGDVALVFCMGAGYLQVAAYFIQQKARQEKANHWTDWIITQISGIESIVVENFAGNDIDKLIFEEMMKKLDKQVAVSGAAAIASKTVTVATESIDYKQIIGTSKEEEKQCNPPPMPTPADNTPILSKRQEGDNQLSKVVIKSINIIQ
ncbi:hypothetical protein WR25_05902 [Diploscapter pachys]|uniref:Uncharacterized protein n=1 Tax=Diploscapter pachys TaxID=2018661 RepID=A0A2A2KEY2_9BILA|nr:hypothetical protein WR25_05902 [Diploscapter pachys]